MPAIFFSNAWMLVGMVALGVPVLIHLLLRRRKKRARFSTLQFFLKQDVESSRRRKLRNWLLLALRLLICALLVLAFARPYLQKPGAAAAGQNRRDALILLDRSLSMQARDREGVKWARAQASVRQILASMKPNDRAALVGFGLRAEVVSEWAPPSVVSRRLGELQPTCGASGLAEALRQARRLLSFRDPGATANVYVVSDLQRSACGDLAQSPLPMETDVQLIPVGDLLTPNLAITGLQVTTPDNALPHASLTSFSDEDSPGTTVEVQVDGQVMTTNHVVLSAAGSTNLELALPDLKPGWHTVAAQVRGSDGLAMDDVRYDTVFVPAPVRVLVAETRPSQRVFEEESFFLSTALDPGNVVWNSGLSRFAVEKVSPDELASRLSENRGTARPCDLVALPGLKQIPSALAAALARYVRIGGGLLLFLGDGVSANRYNTEFRELLPIELGRVESSPAVEAAWRIGDCDTNTALFAAFQAPNSGDLSLARFTSRFTLDGRAEGRAVARFDDGSPFILVRDVGQGRVVLVNGTVDTAWNDWPKHKTYVPWLHGTAEHLAGVTRAAQARPQLQFVAGTETDLDLGTGAAKERHTLVTPGGQERSLSADSAGQLRDVTFTAPGVYSLRDAKGREVRRMAANVPVSESDLTALAPKELQQQIARIPERQTPALAAGFFGGRGNQQDAWRVLLLAVVVLLFFELALANRTVA